jgi:hypothetical protein
MDPERLASLAVASAMAATTSGISILTTRLTSSAATGN